MAVQNTVFYWDYDDRFKPSTHCKLRKAEVTSLLSAFVRATYIRDATHVHSVHYPLTRGSDTATTVYSDRHTQDPPPPPPRILRF